jgi:hypothetical protein
MSFSAKALTMGLLLASSSAFAQEVAPTPTVAPTATPPVEATVQPVTPPPAVRTLPNESDRIAPQAAAEVAAESAERTPEPRQAAAPAPVRRATVAREPVAAPEPSTDAVAPEAPVVADTSAIADNAPIAPMEEPVVEVAQADIAPANDAAENEWLIGAGIAGALGLAGIALLATRRRRRRSGDVVTETAPVAPVTYAEPQGDIARPVEQPLAQPAPMPALAATAVDPLFTKPRHDMPVHNKYAAPVQRTDLPGVTDPLFAYKPVQTPVTDPMFMRTVAVPPITDPMFAKHPEYVGVGATRTGNGWNNGSTGADERTRELEPAE